MKNASTKRKSRTDWKRVKTMKDSEINFSDIPRIKRSDFARAELRMPQPKALVSLRIDPDVLDWFKKHGKGYQTRINSVLRLYVETHSR